MAEAAEAAEAAEEEPDTQKPNVTTVSGLNNYIVQTPNNGKYWFEWALWKLEKDFLSDRTLGMWIKRRPTASVRNDAKSKLIPYDDGLLTKNPNNKSQLQIINPVLTDPAKNKIWEIMTETSNSDSGAKEKLAKIINALMGIGDEPSVSTINNTILQGGKRRSKSRKARKARRSKMSRKSRRSRRSRRSRISRRSRRSRRSRKSRRYIMKV